MVYRSAFLICGLLLLILSACGYQFVQDGKLPGAVRRISVHLFANRTAESGLEHLFTNAVIYEFTRSNIAELVDDGQADAVLTGSIQSLQVSSASRDSLQTSTEMRITVSGSAKLVGTGGKTIWEKNGITVLGTYIVTGDSESNKKDKLKEAAKRFAEKMFQQMTADF